jgi:uncharacterized membrane-anchored protein YhcB (DUF1043 family)
MQRTEVIDLTQPTHQKKALKLDKTRILLIIISILAIAVLALYVVHSRQVHEQNQVHQELTLTESSLEQIQLQLEDASSQKAALVEQLGQTTAQSEAANAILSQPIQSFAVTTTLLDIAKEHSLEMTEMTLADQTTANLGEIPCSVMSLQVTVEGDVEDLVSFVAALNISFPTSVVDSIAIETISGDKASANMVLNIYSRY